MSWIRAGPAATVSSCSSASTYRPIWHRLQPQPRPGSFMAQDVHPALAALRQSGAAKVKVACSDIDGILRGKYLHRDKFEGAADPGPGGGFGFCDVVCGW